MKIAIAVFHWVDTDTDVLWVSGLINKKFLWSMAAIHASQIMNAGKACVDTTYIARTCDLKSRVYYIVPLNAWGGFFFSRSPLVVMNRRTETHLLAIHRQRGTRHSRGVLRPIISRWSRTPVVITHRAHVRMLAILLVSLSPIWVNLSQSPKSYLRSQGIEWVASRYHCLWRGLCPLLEKIIPSLYHRKESSRP